MNQPKKTVYFDGECPMCQAFQGSVSSSTQGEKFTFVDVNNSPLPAGITKEAALIEMHIVDENGTVHKNANSVLEVLSEYKNLGWLVSLGKLPFINTLLRLGYSLVAKNRLFLFGEASRIFWIKILATLGFIAGLVFSVNVWAGERVFPKMPVFEWFSLSGFMEWILYAGLILGLIAILFTPKPQKIIYYLLGGVTFFVLADQMRFQPWVYYYAFILLALAGFSWKYKDTVGQANTLNILRVMVAGIYFYSGLQKLNYDFISDIYPWMIESIYTNLPESFLPTLLFIGILIPFLEMFIGIGFMFEKTRKYALGLALAMCVFVLFTIGPFGHSWNSVVWPWNIVFVSLAFMLFWRQPDLSWRDILIIKNSWLHRLALLLFLVMPLLSFVNLWDAYPSFSLYSNNKASIEITFSNSALKRLPENLQTFIYKNKNDSQAFNYNLWALAEFNVPPYPEARALVYIGEYFCTFANSATEISVVIKARPVWFNQGEDRKIVCGR